MTAARSISCFAFFLFYLTLGAAEPVTAEYLSHGELVYNGITYVPKLTHATVGSPSWFMFLLSALICVSCSACAAGLTIGLVSLDPFELQVLLHAHPEDCPNDEERQALITDQRYAKKVLPIVSRHHFLLVTLMVANAMANEALPIFLDQVLPAWLAVLTSVTLVLIFGEILPSAFFTGPKQLKMAHHFSPLVFFFFVILSPVSYPLARVLDIIFGEHKTESYKKHELKGLLRMHAKVASSDDSPLTALEASAMSSVLDLGEKKAQDVMIPLEQVTMLSSDTVLDESTLAAIGNLGLSSVPVFKNCRSNVCGVLRTKTLVSVGIQDGVTLAKHPLQLPLVARSDTPLLELLRDLRTRRSSIAVISSVSCAVDRTLPSETGLSEAEATGIVSLNDVIETFLGLTLEDQRGNHLGLPVLIGIHTVHQTRSSGMLGRWRSRTSLGRPSGATTPTFVETELQDIPLLVQESAPVETQDDTV